MKFKLLSFAFLFFLLHHHAKGEEMLRPVTQIYSFEIGGVSARSSYLSPLEYTGKTFGIGGEWSKTVQWNPDHLIMNFNAEATLQDMLNPARSASMQGVNAAFAWGMQWRKRLPYSLQITAGGDINLSGGALYLPRNGNNPVNALARIGIDASATLSWRTKIKRLPIVVRERISLPAVGGFFCPEYGETYYEIWLGNRSGLTHFGWWGNNFGVNNHLCVMMDFGRTAMELGYRYRYQSYWANQINTHIAENAITIGIIPHGLGIKRKAPVNSSIY